MWLTLSGHTAQQEPIPFPMILGNDGAGLPRRWHDSGDLSQWEAVGEVHGMFLANSFEARWQPMCQCSDTTQSRCPRGFPSQCLTSRRGLPRTDCCSRSRDCAQGILCGYKAQVMPWQLSSPEEWRLTPSLRQVERSLSNNTTIYNQLNDQPLRVFSFRAQVASEIDRVAERDVNNHVFLAEDHLATASRATCRRPGDCRRVRSAKTAHGGAQRRRATLSLANPR